MAATHIIKVVQSTRPQVVHIGRPPVVQTARPHMVHIARPSLVQYSPTADINNVHLRQIAASLIYFRGMFSKASTKSVPADCVIFDELDEANPINKAQAEERMSHSPYKWKMELSTPTLPDYGIDIEFKKSDQRYWHVACKCKEGIILEDNFPDCVAVRNEGQFDQDVFLYCPKCGKEHLDVCEPAIIGEYRGWVPKYPEIRDIRGYHTAQLFSTAISLSKIWYEYKHTRNIPEFHNSKLGMPYAGDRMPLTADLLQKCCGDYGLVHSARTVFIGVDQGDENYVVVIKVDPNTGQRKIINAVVIEETDPWPETIRLISRYEDAIIVTDAMPDKNDARKLCLAFPGRAFMCYYSDQQKDAIVKDFDPTDPDAGHKITVHRTETLDKMVDGFAYTASGRLDGIVLPSAQLPITQVLMSHLGALAKIKQTRSILVNGGKQETGEVKYVYIHTRPDHFAHATNYATIAEAMNLFLGYAAVW